MKFAILFSVSGLYLLHRSLDGGAAGVGFAWAGTSFLLIGAAYAGLGARVLGKRTNGRLQWWTVMLLLPFFLLIWVTWWLARLFSRENCCDEIVPGLWLGRYPLPGEVPERASRVVDLAAEFPRLQRTTGSREYISLPTLDAGVPERQAFLDVVQAIVASSECTYIHCAQGHGRSAIVMAAVLIAKGLAADVESAERQIRERRPGVKLNRRQQKFVRAATAEFRAVAAPERAT